MTDLNDCEARAVIKSYPIMDAAFGKYINYLCEKVPEDKRELYDLFKILNEKDEELLAKVERWLATSASILGLNAAKFSKSFDFRSLKSEDPDKLYDILAEPLVVIDLHNKGLTSIYKEPPKGSEPVADFTAFLESQKFAIEVKTVRPEKKVLKILRTPSKEVMEKASHGDYWLGSGVRPSWWIEECKKDVLMRAGDAAPQLAATCAREGCQCTMLVVYSRRSGYSPFMGKEEYLGVLKEASRQKGKIQYWGYKWGFENQLVIYPSLPSLDPAA